MELHVLDAGKVTVVLLDNDMKIVKPVYDFLKFQQQKSKADNTLLANGRDLCLFWTFLGKSGYAYDQVTPRMIAEFIDFLRGGDDMLALYKESSRSNRTINRILSTVHTFYQYQADMQEIDNPMLMHGGKVSAIWGCNPLYASAAHSSSTKKLHHQESAPLQEGD